MTNTRMIIARLERWYFNALHNTLSGYIYDDISGREHDGAFVHLSHIQLKLDLGGHFNFYTDNVGYKCAKSDERKIDESWR